MNKLDVLDRHYNSFINLEEPKAFFTLFADYIELTDSIPEFQKVIAEIQAQRKPVDEHLGLLEKKAFDKITEIHSKLLKYTDDNKIQSLSVREAIKEYDNWLKGRTAGSASMPDSLHDQIREIVKQLYAIPEHKKFASQYVEFANPDEVVVNRYAPFKEYDDFQESFEEAKRKLETTLWGHLDEISYLYDVVRQGKEKNKVLVDEYRKNRSSKTAYDVINYQALLGEWIKIEKDEEKDPTFFDVKKVRQWATRIHNHILKSVVFGQDQTQDKVLTTTENKEIPSSFQPKLITDNSIGYLQIFRQTKKHKIGGIKSRHFRLVKCLFSPEDSLQARYNPIFQGYERVFDAIRLPKDKKSGKLNNTLTMKTAMSDIIRFTIKEVQGIKSLQGHVKFEWSGDNLCMNIHPPEGNSLAT